MHDRLESVSENLRYQFIKEVTKTNWSKVSNKINNTFLGIKTMKVEFKDGSIPSPFSMLRTALLTFMPTIFQCF